jgi:DNA-binding CsgD family transcriptional regulator
MVDVGPIAANLRGELTEAQARTLHQLALGQKYSAAAQSLGLSQRTIEQHVQQMRIVTRHKNSFQLGMWYQRHFPNGAPT